MMNAKHFSLSLVVIVFALLYGVAQAQTPRMATVNISAQTDKVHITAEGDVSELRVDVADEQGDVVFQSGAISGQQLDWNMRDSANERVAAGTYLVTVTFRTAAGKLRKRVEQVIVDEAEKPETKRALAPEAVQAPVTTTAPTTGGKIPKFAGTAANATSITNSIITESAQKIGVGMTPTTSTLGKLTVQTATGYYGLVHTDGARTLGTYVGGSSSGATGGWIGTRSNHQLHFFTNNSQPRMTISSSGNVGIGTTTPVNGKLHVEAVSGGAAIYGFSPDGIGVSAKTFGGYAVFAQSNGDGYAGLFGGRVQVNGPLYAKGGLTVTGGCTGCSRLQSDQNLKANFSAINPRLVLNRLAALPIRAWNYKSDEPSVRHLGPVAQDFRTAFNLGADDKHIDMVDANGVTMAAIQGLYQIVQEKDQKIEQQSRQIEQLQARVGQLERTRKKRRVSRKSASR